MMPFIDKYGFEWNDQLTEKIFYFSPIGMAFVSTEGKFLRVNQALSEMLDYSEWELLDKTFSEITSGADLQADLKAVEELKKGTRSFYHLRKSYITKGREIIEARLHVHAIYENESSEVKKVIYFLSTIIPCEVIIEKGEKIIALSDSDKLNLSKDNFTSFFKNNVIQILVLTCTLFGLIYKYGQSQETINQRIISLEKDIKAISTKNDDFLKELREMNKQKEK
jgi:PAS domain S-box-containing protein